MPRKAKSASSTKSTKAEAQLLSTAAKIITRHKLGYQEYTAKRLAWAYKVFTRRGGLARVQSMTPEERTELAKKAAKASVISRRKRARLLTELEKKIGSDKLQALLKD